jgi:hypothetical protein
MLTMLLGGLWHGAAWTFVLWGGLHGAMLCVEHFAGERRMDRIPAWLRWLLVFHIVVFGWILFRSPDLGVVGAFLGAIASPGAASLVTPLVVIAVVVVIGGQLLPPRPLDAVRLRLEALPWGALGAALAVVILVVASTVPSQGVPPFIYFQF